MDQPIAEHGDGRHAEKGAMDGTNAAEYAGAAQDNGSDRKQFITRARISFRLTKTRSIDNCGQRSHRSGQHVNKSQPAARQECLRNEHLPEKNQLRGRSAHRWCDAREARWQWR